MSPTFENIHTPGPWHVRADGSVGSVQRGGMVVAQPCIEPKNQGDQAANARLISAAPELLRALLDVLDRLGALSNPNELLDMMEQEDADKVWAAIAKATGTPL